jgi:hypothetical protein
MTWQEILHALSAIAAAVALIRSFRSERRETAHERETARIQSDDRTRELIQLVVGGELAQLRQDMANNAAHLSSVVATVIPSVVKQTMESTSALIFETAMKMLEIKQKE